MPLFLKMTLNSNFFQICHLNTLIHTKQNKLLQSNEPLLFRIKFIHMGKQKILLKIFFIE